MLSPMPVQRPLSSHSSRGMNGGQKELLPDLVHLFAHDADDLVDGALAEEEVVVNAGAELADVAGAEQELVAGDFGVCRGLTKGGDKELRPTMHRNGLSVLSRPKPGRKTMKSQLPF